MWTQIAEKCDWRSARIDHWWQVPLHERARPYDVTSSYDGN